MIGNHKLVLCGVQQIGIDIIEYLCQHNITIDHIVSITPEKAIQQNVSGYVSYESIANKYNIPIYYAKKYSLKDESDIEFFKKEQFSLIIQGVWQRLFPLEILDSLKVGAIGIHGSSELLPKGRGRSPINWSLIEGKKRFLFHYFIITPGIDDGDTFHIEAVDINEWDDCNTLYLKNSIVTKRILLTYIPLLLSNSYKVFPQEGEPSYYPKRTPEDGIINWELPVWEIHNFIRALTRPYPGAFSYINSEKVTLWEAHPFDSRILYPEAPLGKVVEVFEDGTYLVNCYSGLLRVKQSSLIPNPGEIFHKK